MNNRLKKFALLIGDGAIFNLALYLSLRLRYQEGFNNQIWQDHWLYFFPIFIIWLIVFYIYKLYDLDLGNRSRLIKTLISALLVGTGLAIIFFYLNPQGNIAPKTNLAILVVVSIFLVFIWRRLFYFLLGKYLPKNNLLIVGNNKQIQKLANYIQAKPNLGYQTSLVVENYEGLRDLKKIIQENSIRTIVVSPEFNQNKEVRDILFSCLSLNINFYNLPDFYEMVTGKIPVDIINQAWFLDKLSEGRKKNFNKLKRAYDLFFAFIIFTISLPFWPFIALLIKLGSSGPVLFKQTRVGQNGQNFTMLKFRSMKETNNDRTPTGKQDNRITAFGSLMRKARIDEIPQIINVIKGEMSFIGPRPERPEIVAELSKTIPFYRERLLIKPGLSGWDQVSGEYHSPSEEDSFEKLQYDLFYIKNRSLYLDMTIILKTIRTIISRQGI